ncbi:MAG: hypothetical protein DRI84_01670 [Bacteroidetes bacterium]|nr:MAG: hypothetical protein DRI84_01670 [Bacteroidota bacterium]
MSTSQSLFEGVVVLIAIIMIAVVLKKLGIFKQEYSLTFSHLVLYITLPAVIFSSLALQEFNTTFLTMSLIMALIELLVIFLAWLIATLLKFDSGKKGALMLVSAFGMTSFLGYPIIQQAFPGNALALEEAVVTSEIGVGLLLFILGPLIAMYYGESKVEGKAITASVKQFFTSPIFFSIIAGIGVSFIPLNHDGIVFNMVFKFFKLVGDANLLLVAFTIGLIFEFKGIKNIALFIGIVVVLKLFLKPFLALVLTDSSLFTEMMREIVFIETALPSAILTAVFAKQYNCRPDLVSTAIMITLILSIATVSLSFIYFF